MPKEKFNLKEFQINNPEVDITKLHSVIFTYNEETVVVTKLSGKDKLETENFADSERPHFYQDNNLRLVTVIVDKPLYDKINELIDHFKQKRRFGFTEMNKVWKVIKPLVEKTFGVQEDS